MHDQSRYFTCRTSGQVTGPEAGHGPARSGLPAESVRQAAGAIPDPFAEESPRTPHWFKTAVFYEVSVRGFCDSNNDGYGDLRGLISKLDHLEWLGVDCLWLLPIYQSPLKDGGYDISEYTRILP
ncbi:alpha-amylase family glycosyl hydrolase, partial [Actinomadura opuntiae]|uniref:alpha-amylase family glycosyl hydrolase n=1 Tax=Actinomadura sp. OS1-43 TaxID=604315 RepID=UPI00255B04CE